MFGLCDVASPYDALVNLREPRWRWRGFCLAISLVGGNPVNRTGLLMRRAGSHVKQNAVPPTDTAPWQCVGLAYTRLRRRITAKPARAVPSKASEAGSGTAAATGPTSSVKLSA